jgi:hypothetical protein
MSEIAFKFLAVGREPVHGGVGAWPEPGLWTPEREPVPCASGWHGCRPRQLIWWIGPELWRAEFEGVVDAGDKIVARRARLVERIIAWDERSARLFACDCAERVVRLTGPDERCVNAIAVARRFAAGEAMEKERAWAAAAAGVAAAAAGAAGEAAAAGLAAGEAAAAAWVAAGVAERAWQTSRLLETLGLPEAS